MSSVSNKYNDPVVKSLLAKNEFGIIEVHDIEEVSSMYFIRSEYPEIIMLIKNGGLDAIRSMVKNTSEDREYLYIISFRDQRNTKYIATIYDSDELWQDPEVMEVFPVK